MPLSNRGTVPGRVVLEECFAMTQGSGFSFLFGTLHRDELKALRYSGKKTVIFEAELLAVVVAIQLGEM